jgi:formylmethanofuran dehydrogenase subunit E-like metal-binding protein
MERRKSGADTKEAEETVKGKWEAFVDPYNALLPESNEWDQFVETVGTAHKLDEDQLTVLLYH